MDLYAVVSSFRELDKINVRETVQAEVVLSAKMNLCPAFFGAELVTLNKREVDRAFLITQIFSSFDEHISPDIAQAGITVAVSFFF